MAGVLVSAFQSALLPQDASVDRVLVLPTLLPLKSVEVSAQLASLPKPVTCIAFGNRVALVLGYWIVPSGVNDSFGLRYPAALRQGQSRLARDWHVQDVDSPVAIELRSGTVSLPWTDYWTLRESYVTPYLAWYEDRPSKALARAGYVCSVSVHASTGIWGTATERVSSKR